MSLSILIDRAILLEGKVSRCYQALSEIITERDLVDELQELSREELDHANQLKAGKNYIRSAPGTFGETGLSVEEVNTAIEQVSQLIEDVENRRVGIAQGLKRISELEEKFEKIHLKTIVEIKDRNLKALFQALGRDDREHSERLKNLISKWTA
jgi:rubrerythrin